MNNTITLNHNSPLNSKGTNLVSNADRKNNQRQLKKPLTLTKPMISFNSSSVPTI